MSKDTYTPKHLATVETFSDRLLALKIQNLKDLMGGK